jgi:hypothetical protein
MKSRYAHGALPQSLSKKSAELADTQLGADTVKSCIKKSCDYDVQYIAYRCIV